MASNMFAFVCLSLVLSNVVNGQLYQNLAGYARPISNVRQVSVPVSQRVSTLAPVRRVVQRPAEFVDETPKPFNFNYNFVDEYGNQQYREEVADANGNVRGRYGYTDANGIYRQAEYTADGYGSSYQIQTNEPGTKTSQPADVVINSDAAVYAAPEHRAQIRRTQIPQRVVNAGPVRRLQVPVRQTYSLPQRQRYVQPIRNAFGGLASQGLYANQY